MELAAGRLRRISPSMTVALTAKARALRAEGRDIVALTSGEPDFDTPENIKAAAKAAIDRGDTKYTPVAGTPALRKAVCDRFRTDRGIVFDPSEIIIANGGKQIIFDALMATVDPGDEAIIPAPCWVSYPDIVKLAEGVPVIVDCDAADGFRLRPDRLEAAITSRTRWFILNNPCNPTGAAYSADALRPLTDVLLRHPHVWILTDDIYEKLAYGGVRPATILEVEPRLRDRTVTMNGVSKAYAMTGWRIGYAAAPADLVRQMEKLQGQSTGNPCSVAQAAAVEALTGPQTSVETMRDAYRRRRDLVADALHETPGLACPRPEGAFYVYPSMAGCLGRRTARGTAITDDESFCAALLDETGVATVHGAAFLHPGHFRISYATADENLVEACRRIRAFCEALT